MNTSQLKSFAQEARSILLEGVGLKLQYWGFNEKGEVGEEPQSVTGGVIFRGTPIDDPTIYARWKALKQAVNNRGVRDVIEEATYTWFNRFMAIRILSKNGYETSQVEYTSEESKVPQILTRARRGQYDFLSAEEKKQLDDVITDYSKENEAFGILIKGYCHSHPLISQVFGNLDDFTELLLSDNILSDSGFIHLLNTSDAITDEDYQKVELIGWLYQFYISQRKDEVFASFKKNKKAEAEDIPAATQIFTPNWIVKYMVQNTVGKQWLDLKPVSEVKDNLKYLVENESAVADPIINEAADIKLLDPAVGSGHILVEGFDILFECFMEEYYTPEEAVKTILTKSLYGLDLDKRAMQLARFAVLLKAAKHYPEIIQQPIMPRVYSMPEGVHFSRQEILDFLGDDLTDLEEPFSEALKLMYNSKNLGSIMQFDLDEEDRKKLLMRWNELEDSSFRSMNEEAVLVKVRPYLEVLVVLTQTYESVVANPPYMGQKSMNANLKDYVNKMYPITKSDLMTVFMEVGIKLTAADGLLSCINIPSWMFLPTFEDFRKKLLEENDVLSLIHNGRGVFGSDFGSVAFCLVNGMRNKKSVYRRLFKEHVKVDSNEIKEHRFLDKSYGYYEAHQKDFLLIPSQPIAYWITKKVISLFENGSVGERYKITAGVRTSADSTFLRQWTEISFNKASKGLSSGEELLTSDRKWFAFNKGGAFRKWFGNVEHVIDFENNAYNLRHYAHDCRLRDPLIYFKEGITWSRITSGSVGFRISEQGSLAGDASPIWLLESSEHRYTLLALLNTKITQRVLGFINPTMTYQVRDISLLPYKNVEINSVAAQMCKENISISQNDWNSYETSWDFEKSPLIKTSLSLKDSVINNLKSRDEHFFSIHQNEEELNRIFIDIYGLQNELDPYVPLKDITILQDELDRKQLEEDEKKLREQGIGIKAKDKGLPLLPEGYELPIDRVEVMRQFISYAIGCWMGRYRLDKLGLAVAHRNPSEGEVAPYKIPCPLHEGTNQVAFNIREDAIIPLMGKSGSFPQDAANLVPQFIEYIWRQDTYTENINFLEECLDKDLEKYLIKDFWKDHCRRYKKRPIYWLFSSERGAFQVLVYMHRMNRFTVEKIRSEYLLPHMKFIQTQIDLLTRTGQDPKTLDRIIKDLEECESYDLELKDKADQQIEFDLDDGVVANYKLFEGVVAKIK